MRLNKILLTVRRKSKRTMCWKRLPEIGVHYKDWTGKRRLGKVQVIKLATFDKFYFQSV